MSTTCNGRLKLIEDTVLDICMHDQRAYDIWLRHVKEHVVKNAYHMVMQTSCKTIVMSTAFLYELGLDWMFDEVITVMSSVDEMHKTALAMPGMTEERFKHLNAMHIPLQEKRRMSSYYIDASNGKASTAANALQLINKRIERCF